MIARVGFFEQFDFDDREFVLEVIGSMPGFRGAYHLVDRDSGDALSVSFWDSDAHADAGQEAVGERFRSGGHGGPGPVRAQRFEVVHHLGDGVVGDVPDRAQS
jgi:heme-degrading monooxygenase HmoA